MVVAFQREALAGGEGMACLTRRGCSPPPPARRPLSSWHANSRAGCWPAVSPSPPSVSLSLSLALCVCVCVCVCVSAQVVSAVPCTVVRTEGGGHLPVRRCRRRRRHVGQAPPAPSRPSPQLPLAARVSSCPSPGPLPSLSPHAAGCSLSVVAAIIRQLIVTRLPACCPRLPFSTVSLLDGWHLSGSAGVSNVFTYRSRPSSGAPSLADSERMRMKVRRQVDRWLAG
jgi:hypothetical protein